MSFDIAFLRYHNGKPASIDREQVRAVLGKQHVDPSRSGEGNYEVQFGDGSYVELTMPCLERPDDFDGFGAGFRSMTDSVVTFLFEFARSADLVIGLEADDEVYILVDPHQKRHLPTELDASVTVCSSPEALAQALSGGYGEWRDYRDQILRPDFGNEDRDA